MTYARKANVVADAAILDALPKVAFKIRSWDNNHARKSQDQVFAFCRLNISKGENGLAPLTWEAVFDAAHGRRYMLFIYRDAAGRKACWDCLTGEIQ